MVIRPSGDEGTDEDIGGTVFIEPPIMLRSDTSTKGLRWERGGGREVLALDALVIRF